MWLMSAKESGHLSSSPEAAVQRQKVSWRQPRILSGGAGQVWGQRINAGKV